MPCNTLTETQFFSLVSTIASQHGCRLVDIDVDKQIINIAGPSESEYACAVESKGYSVITSSIPAAKALLKAKIREYGLR